MMMMMLFAILLTAQTGNHCRLVPRTFPARNTHPRICTFSDVGCLPLTLAFAHHCWARTQRPSENSTHISGELKRWAIRWRIFPIYFPSTTRGARHRPSHAQQIWSSLLIGRLPAPGRQHFLLRDDDKKSKVTVLRSLGQDKCGLNVRRYSNERIWRWFTIIKASFQLRFKRTVGRGRSLFKNNEWQ